MSPVGGAILAVDLRCSNNLTVGPVSLFLTPPPRHLPRL
jgi:hypothetical protein